MGDLISFSLRTPKRLAASMEATAKRLGMSKSEYARRAMEEFEEGLMHERIAELSGNLPAPLRTNSSGAPDLQRWVTENGINPHQFIELPVMPNFLMPAVLREMDCALQVSRCEPCTNLPAKEAMACGVPVILADNTGAHDLIDVDSCISLTSQDPVLGEPGWDTSTDGWGESRVEEIVESLERLYTDSQMRKRIGTRGAEWILEHRRTWQAHASTLKSHLWSLL